MTFALASLALLAGPALVALAERRPATRETLDGFVLITIAGIVGLHILPEAWDALGAVSVVLFLAGLAFPVLLEAVYRRALERAHLVVLLVAAVGLVVHSMLDGIALLPAVDENGHAEHQLAIGVIVHRLPVGMAVWWLLRPRFGAVVALSVFALIILGTAVTYGLGAGHDFEPLALTLFQCFVAGSLLHVALFGASHEHKARAGSWWFRAGLLLGGAAVFLLPHGH
ncbi:MAG: hypothetical protein AAGE43_09765 [Pseudomonadota bacterium]